MKKSTQLRQLLEERKAHLCPGAHDALSAKLIETAGFKMVQGSGFGLAASVLGLPDMGFLSGWEMTEFTKNMINTVDIPVMADADTGFGNALIAMRATEMFIKIGAAGMNIEDQAFPKRCGHLDGKQVIPTEEMVLKIKACAKVRDDLDKDFVINARTDAIIPEGVDNAIERAKAYKDAGADMIFMEAPESEEQIDKIIKEVDGLISINLFDMISGGKTPIIHPKRLAELGVARVSVPVGVLFAAIKGMQNYLEAIKNGDPATEKPELAAPFDEAKEILGFADMRKLEKEYLPNFV